METAVKPVYHKLCVLLVNSRQHQNIRAGFEPCNRVTKPEPLQQNAFQPARIRCRRGFFPQTYDNKCGTLPRAHQMPLFQCHNILKHLKGTEKRMLFLILFTYQPENIVRLQSVSSHSERQRADLLNLSPGSSPNSCFSFS